MNVTIVGTGYVGLVTGACLAEVGISVTCVDIDQQKIDNLKEGIMPIYEPGLDSIVTRNYNRGRLNFSTCLADAIKGTDVVFIAVGTPPDEDGSADLQYVIGVAREIGQNMDNYMAVVTKSTVPVGTAWKVKQALNEELEKRNSNLSYDVVSNPEFLKEGAAVSDFLKPDRIVVGVESERAKELLGRLYKPFLMNGHPVVFMDIASAEMTKYAANSMLATKISFMNDVANLCEIVGADVNMVRKGIGSDPRIGNKFIYPGIGYGGSCFPKDVKALINTATENGYSMEVLKAVDEVNNAQKTKMYDRVESYYGKDKLAGKKVAMWGLSFKPNTDDMREAPSLELIDKFIEAGMTVSAYDPVAAEEAQRIMGDKITYARDEYDALMGADLLLVATEWPLFRYPDFEQVRNLMNHAVIFDGRNIYDQKEMESLGFEYYCVGVRNDLRFGDAMSKAS